MIQTLLIANRGEIACRIIRTARAMGIATVAVYSDADAGALHVRCSDVAVRIGAAPAAESYLLGDRIIAAARETGADAIHPGYGFLSENAEFAQSVIDAGLTWVGPRPASIRAMGLKDAAKERMIAAGVPVTPGYLGSDQSPERLAAEAERIGYPVLIKAVAGGGGKGMRKVDNATQFLEMLGSCRREATASFGNDQVLLEKWITAPRHIEVQVFGDSHGNVVHLFERDCSLQRRHQKVIEEAPAPGMDDATREAICAAAVRAAKAVDYEGAGTIEFIADASDGLRADRIFFMEMNTRLQVEHPVTEEITGVDLVEWQLKVAGGEPIPLRQEDLAIRGHAVEARLYAEDPAAGFLPSIGRLDALDLRDDLGRTDTGVVQGSEVTPFYDPMIAKMITHAPTRDGALDALARKLREAVVWPVRTNKGFLVRLLEDPDVRAARLDTGLIARRFDDLVERPVPTDRALGDAARALLAESCGGDPVATGIGAFRLNADAPAQRLSVDGEEREFRLAPPLPPATRFLPIELPGHRFVAIGGDIVTIALPRATGGAGGGARGGDILSPMPGKVIAVDVAEGHSVTAGQRLLVLEAMKMEHALAAPFDGTVTALNARVGGQVQVEALLAVVQPADAGG